MEIRRARPRIPSILSSPSPSVEDNLRRVHDQRRAGCQTDDCPKRVTPSRCSTQDHEGRPINIASDSATEIMLIKSRETSWWVILEGWPQARRTAAFSEALSEAFEAAEVGSETLRGNPTGAFGYLMVEMAGEKDPIRVGVFSVSSRPSGEDRPNPRQREIGWLKPAKAAVLMARPVLGKFFLKVTAIVGRNPVIAAGQ